MSAQLPQFDSHRFVKRLVDAGVSEKVAEILADEHASRIVPADVATRADVEKAANAIRADLAEFKDATEARFAAARDATEARFTEARDATEAKFAEARDATEAKFAESRNATRADLEKAAYVTEARMIEFEARIRADTAARDHRLGGATSGGARARRGGA